MQDQAKIARLITNLQEVSTVTPSPERRAASQWSWVSTHVLFASTVHPHAASLG